MEIIKTNKYKIKNNSRWRNITMVSPWTFERWKSN